MKAKYKIVEWQYHMNIIHPCVPVWWLFSVPMYKWHQSTYLNKHLSVEDKREWAHPLDNHWKSRTYWGHNISQRKITLLYYSQYHPVGQMSTEFWWPFSERLNMTHLDRVNEVSDMLPANYGKEKKNRQGKALCFPECFGFSLKCIPPEKILLLHPEHLIALWFFPVSHWLESFSVSFCRRDLWPFHLA